MLDENLLKYGFSFFISEKIAVNKVKMALR